MQDQNAVRAFHIVPNELEDALRMFTELDFIGLNLTVPHKIPAAGHLQEVDENARRIGAVNGIAISDDKMRGFNTDGRGFSRAIREEFSVDLRDLRVLVLGAGGAARAIALQCARENCERLVIANRTFEKAKALAEEFREFFAGPKVLGPVPRLQAIPWEEAAFRFQIANIDLIVNATPLGLNRADASPLPARLLAPHLMIYDTIYSNIARHLFLPHSKQVRVPRMDYQCCSIKARSHLRFGLGAMRQWKRCERRCSAALCRGDPTEPGGYKVSCVVCRERFRACHSVAKRRTSRRWLSTLI